MSTAVSTEENAKLALRFRENIWKDLNVADDIIAADAVFHINDPLSPQLEQGPAGYKKLVSMYLDAFPDAGCRVDEIVAEKNMIVARWSGGGTQEGSLGNIPPTGNQISITGIDIHRIEDGRIKETWMNWDTLGMLTQLGISLG